MKKTLLTLLIFALLLSSCSNSTSDDTPDDAANGGQTTGDVSGEKDADSASSGSEAEEETEENYNQYYPTGSYGGADFVMLKPLDENWCLDNLVAEDMTADAYNDSIYMRNSWVEDQYKVKISAFETSDVPGAIRTAVTANDPTYSIGYPTLSGAASLATGNNLLDLKQVSGLNLAMPWWDKAAQDALTVADRLYFAENDINIQFNEATWVLFFNKDLIETNLMDSPYDLVRENTWTMDKMHEMMEVVSDDANGNGYKDAPDDYFGFSTHWSSYLGLLAGAGQALVVSDGAGGYVSNLATEKMVDIAVKIGEIINDEEATVIPDRFPGASQNDNEWARMTFYNGHSLFYGEAIGNFARMREMEPNFGLLPFPKYETSQEYFTCKVLNTAYAYVIPNAGVDTDFVAAVTEALAIHSHTGLMPAYLDVTVTGKSIRDKESKEMLDIIFEYRMYDIGDIYGWGNVSATFQSAVDKGGDSYMSTVKSSEKALNKSIKATLEKFTEEGNGD